MNKTTLCNIPEDVLAKQLLIDSIPSITILAILLISTIITLIWIISARNELKPIFFKTALISFFIVFFPLWYKCSFMATKVATNVFNSEYATIIKFAQGCPQSLK